MKATHLFRTNPPRAPFPLGAFAVVCLTTIVLQAYDMLFSGASLTKRSG